MVPKAALLLGDCLEQLKTLPDNSVDSIVTDPPYGLSFMGKKWDYDVPSVELWREALRVLKPGGHLLSFGGTRTYHRMVVNIEDAGFEIRDQVMWLYGSGFPKSHNIARSIDKHLGVEPLQGEPNPAFRAKQLEHDTDWETAMRPEFKTKPNSAHAKQWEGWGTALKPANEPICVARKPLEKGLTVAQNVLKYGTGALNIDASRIETDDVLSFGSREIGDGTKYSPMPKDKQTPGIQNPQGRWPANLILDEEAAAALDDQSGILKNGGQNSTSKKGFQDEFVGGRATKTKVNASNFSGDSGGASRFFYVAKASKRERGEGNVHPTVKPIKLMEYLIKLVTPTGGIVLDPFMGSGTTGVAASKVGADFIGCEREAEYHAIAKRRIEWSIHGGGEELATNDEQDELSLEGDAG